MAKTKSKKPFKKVTKKSNKANAKHPISILYSMKPDVTIKEAQQTGPKHKPTFTMELNVDSRCFFGTGKSKKEAKYKAAVAALEFLGYNPSTKSKISTDKDSISKQVASTRKPCPSNIKKDIAVQHSSKNPLNNVVDTPCPVDPNDVACWARTNLGENDEKHPISKLNALNYKVTRSEIVQQTGPAQNASFKMKIIVNGQIFYGTGKSKELAELQAAFIALRYFESYDPTKKVKTTSPGTANRIIRKTEEISKEEQFEFLQKQMQILNEVYPISPSYEHCDETDVTSSHQDSEIIILD